MAKGKVLEKMVQVRWALTTLLGNMGAVTLERISSELRYDQCSGDSYNWGSRGVFKLNTPSSGDVGGGCQN